MAVERNCGRRGEEDWWSVVDVRKTGLELNAGIKLS